ncbi:Uma2 family endonuclease [Nocardiopsis composta]|uniref:Uma2 family endonuclease n=1 Tax=Nocardiopsis composta TaxID=157465 RepID=A0A7W8VGY6_9ACTN|nr:Uma2 family endonuclease [Nocardiopsis composta]MBB5436091.1 Uma2 family endonuclease [Nocardiopsis composta]
MSVTAPELPDVFKAAPEEPLRSVADRMAEMLPPGYRVEILGGELVVSPTPSVIHMGDISLIRRQIDAQLPATLITGEVLSAGLSGDSGDLAIPDLAVLPVTAMDDYGTDWLVSPDTVEFVMEVVSPGNSKTDTVAKVDRYASWAIPIYLLVDPRDGTVVCRSAPRDGEYQAIRKFTFGDMVKLPSPLDNVRIDTAELRRYP